MKVRALLFFISFLNVSYAQLNFEADTLLYTDRISGALDTVDIANSRSGSIADGGYCMVCPEVWAHSSLLETIHGRVFQQKQNFGPIRFSALPHIGFAYSFGGNGIQYLHATYQQAFSDRLLLNVDYVKENSNGYIRNSSYGLNDLRVQLQRRGKLYSFKFNGGYQKNEVNHPGGLVATELNDSIVELFGLEFASVNKSVASSVYKSGILNWKNYFNFTGDSVVQTGLMTNHDYSIRNRVYNESDTVYGLYTAAFIDSFVTRDQFNLPSITNGAGAYFSSRKLYLDGQFEHTFWDYQNLGVHHDTTEIAFRSAFKFGVKNLSLSNNLYFNLAGRFNEMINRSTIGFNNKRIKVNAGLLFSNLAPAPMYRDYYGNNMNVNLQAIDKQFILRLNGSMGVSIIDSMLELGARFDQSSIRGAYIYADTSFRNDTLADYDITSLNVNAHFRFKALNILASYTFNTDNEGFLPATQLFARLYFKTKLFKAKKLGFNAGVDFTYTSAYIVRSYIPMIDMFDFFNPGSVNNSLTDLSGFIALSIDEFKFYVRYENAGYFWNDVLVKTVNHYPLQSPRLRVGLTWDFFN